MKNIFLKVRQKALYSVKRPMSYGSQYLKKISGNIIERVLFIT